MKAVIINEVDSFLFRPHITLRAQYHAVSFSFETFNFLVACLVALLCSLYNILLYPCLSGCFVGNISEPDTS
jgi:hypothetical protein